MSPRSHVLTPRNCGLDAAAFRLMIEYDGTGYAGWQRQPHAASVQQTIEEALEEILGHGVRCDGAGRTDAGVHALGQVGRIVTSRRTITADGIRRGGNTHLPDDIRIVSAEPCEIAFDPRRDARRRWYRYSIFARPSGPALERHRLCHVPQRMDWSAVEEGLALLRGRHDFAAFRTAACTAARTVLTLEKAEHVAPAPSEPPIHHLDFECRSYLHSQIRMMAGLLIEIATGKHRPTAIGEVLAAGAEKRSPSIHYRTAPPQGLVLMRVEYGE